VGELSSNVGAQYFWWDRVFNWRGLKNENSVFYQALHVSRPGTLDTSLVSTDNINNPRTMNAVYYLLPRMLQAKKWGKETLAGGGLKNKEFQDFPATNSLSQFFVWPSTTWTPRVLKDSADSVGALGALNRVYINIGLFSEEWLLHFRPVIGGQALSPIPIETAQKFELVARDRDADAEHGAVLPRQHRPALPEGRAGRIHLPDRRRRHAGARQDRLRGRCARCHSARRRRCRPGSISKTRTARTISPRGINAGRGRRPTASSSRCGRWSRPATSSGQLPVERAARADHAARHQRVQSAGDQRDPQQHLGQLLVRVMQQLPSVGSIKIRTRSPARRWTIRCRPARLHQAGVAGQRVVDRAVHRTTPSGRSRRSPSIRTSRCRRG
jgi:hypothetical protein